MITATEAGAVTQATDMDRRTLNAPGADAPRAVLRDPTYTMGRSDAETERLMMQARLYDVPTRQLFTEAGITTGMTVLDVGSGAGDVALLAADLVGATGRVIGVDLNPAVLATARARASAAGLTNVSFVQGDARTVALDRLGGAVDAVVGRLVLMYMADPAQALQALARRVRPGGVVVFQEIDLAHYAAYAATIGAPLAQTVMTWLVEVFARSGAETAMGRMLPAVYRAAGLGVPHLSLHAPLGYAPEWAGYDYAAAGVRSVLPLLEQYSLAAAAEVDADTLAARLRAELAPLGLALMLPPHIGAWVRTAPHASA